MTRRCDHCGGSYEPLSGRSRWCSERCRSRARRRGARRGSSTVEQAPRVPGAVTAGTVTALGTAVDTALGQLALNLALRLDNGVPDAALAALARELRETVDAALATPGAPEFHKGRTGRRPPRRRRP